MHSHTKKRLSVGVMVAVVALLAGAILGGSADAKSKKKKIASSITISVKQTGSQYIYSGTVSSVSACASNRMVVLQSIYQGTPTNLGQTTTDNAGNWTIQSSAAPGGTGSILAEASTKKISKKKVCKVADSNSL